MLNRSAHLRIKSNMLVAVLFNQVSKGPIISHTFDVSDPIGFKAIAVISGLHCPQRRCLLLASSGCYVRIAWGSRWSPVNIS